MSYQKRITHKMMDVEGSHDEFGPLIARCHGVSGWNIFLLIVFGGLTIAMFKVYQEASLSSKKPSMIILICCSLLVLYIVTTLFDEYCFYECGLIRKTLLKPEKEKLAYDEIVAFYDRKVWMVSRHMARTQRYWVLEAIDKKRSISIDITSFKGIDEVTTMVHQATGPWAPEKEKPLKERPM